MTSGSAAYFCALERHRSASHSVVEESVSSQAWKATGVFGPAFQPLSASSWAIATFICLERSAEAPLSGRSETINLVGLPVPSYVTPAQSASMAWISLRLLLLPQAVRASAATSEPARRAPRERIT